MATPVGILHSHWHYHFDNLQFSSAEFYISLEELLQQKKVPDLSTLHIGLPEGNLLSPKRGYLRVTRGEYIFDICAAPFGTSFFVSWWLGEIPGCMSAFFKRKNKTYYQIDTEIMFKEVVRACVQEAIERMSTLRGYRELTEQERIPKEYKSVL